MIASLSWSDIVASLTDRGRAFLGADVGGDYGSSVGDILKRCKVLLTRRGEASGHALSREILDRYAKLSEADRLLFFKALAIEFPIDRARLDDAIANIETAVDEGAFATLAKACESPRMELLRRLNHAKDATLILVRMRGDLRRHLKENQDLAAVDADFVAVFSSWFNKGFLKLRRIDWQTPAALLEKIMTYEAVHGMAGWDELKARIEPEDRCIYGFFHPSLADEPLVFIEVALMDEMPDSIDMILLENRKIMTSKASRTAVFYSISNCQDGLRGIPLGSFLIKQVVEDLKTRFPSLKEFVTLSPVPGFASWMRENASAEFDTDTIGEARPDEALKPQIMAAAAHYLCAEKSGAGMPRDPVARFHLGNGARLERLNWNANLSKAGQLQSFGVMANYHYKLDDIELNHERFFELGTIAATATVTKLAKAHRDRPQAAQIAEAEIAPAPATAN